MVIIPPDPLLPPPIPAALTPPVAVTVPYLTVIVPPAPPLPPPIPAWFFPYAKVSAVAFSTPVPVDSESNLSMTRVFPVETVIPLLAFRVFPSGRRRFTVPSIVILPPTVTVVSVIVQSPVVSVIASSVLVMTLGPSTHLA